jgi:hypothetical protein
MPHQDEIDRALKGYVAAIQVKSNAAIKLQEAWTAIKDYKKLEKQIVPTLKLSQLRERLGLVYGTEANNAGSRDAEPSGERRVWQRSQLDLVYEILVEARRTVDEWGGDLYLVYLPVYYRYVPDSDTARNSELEQVVALARKAGLSTINIDDRFKTHNDPLSLFPFRLPGHYNAEGHRQVAEEVLERLTAE